MTDEDKQGTELEQPKEQPHQFLNVEEEYARTHSVNLELAALATEAAQYRHKARSIGSKAVALFDAISLKDTVAYNSFLKVLAKVSPALINGTPAPVLADAAFAEMQRVHAGQRAANAAWYERLAAALLSDAEISAGPPRIRVKPNARTVATLMDAYGRLGTPEGARRTEDLLDALRDAWVASDHSVSLAPNLVCYNTVLTAWAKAGGSLAATNCLRLFDRLPVPPDRISYNAVLHAVARSGWRDAGARAEAILKDDMMQFAAAGCGGGDDETAAIVVAVTPNARSYTTCMDAWGQGGQFPDRAHALLTELQNMHRATGDEGLRPNIYSYTTVIHAYAASKHACKAAAAYAVFTDMIDAGVAPNRVAYNSLLNCCATSTPHPELVDMVETLYRQLLQLRTDGPDHVTFGTVLKACCNLLWKDESFAVAVFTEACDRGQVSSGVLWQFRQAVPIDIYRKLIGDDQTLWIDLPEAWTCNVREERGRRTAANSSNIGPIHRRS